MSLFNPIRMEIPTVAVAKARAKRSASGIAYIPQKTRSFEAELRWHWQASKNEMIPQAPTGVSIVCFLPRPKKLKKTVLLPVTKPDLDNYAKSILDALNGFAWRDDNQVCDLSICKRYTNSSPMIAIHIFPVVAA